MEKKISVIIPNYNGKHLLEKNLAKVIQNCKDCEIIIVDDASTDSSIEFILSEITPSLGIEMKQITSEEERTTTERSWESISRTFKKIKIIKLTKNKGFAFAVNSGLKAAEGNLIVLLNSDVSPRESFLKASLKYFKDPTMFAVGFADLSHEGKRIAIRGRGCASFKKGFVTHYKSQPVSGETLWVSAGSGIFDKKKLLDLGGFDTIFAPFYWEDIDISFRAWQAGYKCIFEPKSKVDHFHEEGAIKKSKSAFFIKKVSYTNQILFVWKNISDPLWLIQHLLWLPYHFAKALMTFDVAFFAGFLWALIKVPSLIFDSSLIIHSPREVLAKRGHSTLSDREVLARFEK